MVRTFKGAFLILPPASNLKCIHLSHSLIFRASPEVASYPFTTLMPNLGVIKGKEHFEVDASETEDFMVGQRATLADLPGLIQGAHTVRSHCYLSAVSQPKLSCQDSVNKKPQCMAS